MLFGHFSFQGTGHLKLHEVVKQRRGNQLNTHLSAYLT